MNNESTAFYKEYGYVVIKNFIPDEELFALAERMRMAQADEQSKEGGYFRDQQVPLAYSKIALYDDLLERVLPECAGLMGVPNLCTVSSYARIYENGAELRAHQDRPELQHSATVCLSRDSNVWNLCLYDLKGNLVKITQSAGDALFYRGKLVHWREGSYQGHEQVQVFLHYYDSRVLSLLMIGLAKIFYHKKLRGRIKLLSGSYATYLCKFGRLVRKQLRRWCDCEL
jgi:hypothetical protein